MFVTEHRVITKRWHRQAYGLECIDAADERALSLMTGLLGTNVGGIPGTDSQWAFLVVTKFLVVLAIVRIAWFKKIKWL